MNTVLKPTRSTAVALNVDSRVTVGALQQYVRAREIAAEVFLSETDDRAGGRRVELRGDVSRLRGLPTCG